LREKLPVVQTTSSRDLESLRTNSRTVLNGGNKLSLSNLLQKISMSFLSLRLVVLLDASSEESSLRSSSSLILQEMPKPKKTSLR